LSEQLDLAFDRGDNGYIARRNIDVLSSMREAAQKLRARRGMLRFSGGWQACPLKLPVGMRQLAMPSMSTGENLSFLDGRLIDLWFGGLLECQPLIAAPLVVLQANRLALAQTLMAVPVLRWNYVLVSHRNHPLQKLSKLTPEHLSSYPSPALPIGVSPLFTRELQRHGLATSPYGSRDYDPMRWEAAAADGHTLAVVPPHRLRALEATLDLVPLPYTLPIQEVMAFIGHRDVISDPSFALQFQLLRDTLRASILGSTNNISWLY
jgi:hypothetical protein